MNHEDQAVINFLESLKPLARGVEARVLFTAAITGIRDNEHWNEEGEPAYDSQGKATRNETSDHE